MKGAALVSVVLGLATVASLVSATYEALKLSNQELSNYEQQVADSLSSQLIELEKTLRLKLRDNKDPIENMKVVKELLAGVSALKISKKKALKMVAKLDDASKDCSHKSYKVFAKNHIANIGAKRDLRNSGCGETLRSQIMLDFYQKLHSERCLSVEREMFHLTLARVDEKNLQRVQFAFKEINRYDYHYDGIKVPADWIPDSERKRFLTMRLDDLTGSPTPRATEKIVKNLIVMVKTTDEWAPLKPRIEVKTAESVIPRPPKKILDEFLFKPCADYEQLLGQNLNHARLDAMAEEEGDQFLADREPFYKGMVHSRICKQVLEEQSKLYKVLADMWVDNIKQSYLKH